MSAKYEKYSAKYHVRLKSGLMFKRLASLLTRFGTIALAIATVVLGVLGVAKQAARNIAIIGVTNNSQNLAATVAALSSQGLLLTVSHGRNGRTDLTAEG
jgi:hypothetical protein